SRAKEIMDAIVDPKIGAIIFACGGEHSERLLPYLDPLKIRKHSKIIIGYSDISSILSYFVETCHRVVYHGRMALDATSNTKKQTKMLREVLEGRLSKITLPSLKVLRPGKAEGILKGGCISVLTKLLHGEYEPFYHHCILFIEDIHESIHSLSLFFHSFEKAKKFNHLKGVLFGEMLDCGDNLELIFLISQYFSRLNLPIGINLPSGHGKNDVFLPLGAHVLISLGSKRSYLKVLPKKTGEYL
ncbi:MAG: LD-carboxypeptidase, partial [Candidatus Aureabacteria bacterium]|nr:LD-carboxypeptidase [Candidatus Auribacterota bacterium]